MKRILVVVACSLSTLALLPLAARSQTPGGRGYVAGVFAVDFGAGVEFVSSVEGGTPFADVLEKMGPGGLTRKQIGPVKYSPIDLMVTAQQLPRLVGGFVSGQGRAFDATIQEMDLDHDLRTRTTLSRAVVTEVEFPEIDAASKNPGRIRVRLQAESVRRVSASGRGPASPIAAEAQWLPRDFRMELDGLDCGGVNKIEAFTIKQGSRIEYPNLSVQMSAITHGGPAWAEWVEDFVVRGNSGDDREKSGRIVLLKPNREGEVLRIELGHVGAFRIERRDGSNSQRLDVDLYVEEMRLAPPSRGLLQGPALSDPPRLPLPR